MKSLGTQEVRLGEEFAFVRRTLEFQPPEANLEARLSHLYAESHRLAFVPSPGAGLLARVDVPLRAAATTERPVVIAGRSRRGIRL